MMIPIMPGKSVTPVSFTKAMGILTLLWNPVTFWPTVFTMQYFPQIF
jgi:hypothetical protein